MQRAVVGRRARVTVLGERRALALHPLPLEEVSSAAPRASRSTTPCRQGTADGSRRVARCCARAGPRSGTSGSSRRPRSRCHRHIARRSSPGAARRRTSSSPLGAGTCRGRRTDRSCRRWHRGRGTFSAGANASAGHASSGVPVHCSATSQVPFAPDTRPPRAHDVGRTGREGNRGAGLGGIAPVARACTADEIDVARRIVGRARRSRHAGAGLVAVAHVADGAHPADRAKRASPYPLSDSDRAEAWSRFAAADPSRDLRFARRRARSRARVVRNRSERIGVAGSPATFPLRSGAVHAFVCDLLGQVGRQPAA